MDIWKVLIHHRMYYMNNTYLGLGILKFAELCWDWFSLGQLSWDLLSSVLYVMGMPF